MPISRSHQYAKHHQQRAADGERYPGVQEVQAITEHSEAAEQDEIPDIKGVYKDLEEGKEERRKSLGDLEVKRQLCGWSARHLVL